MIICGIFVVECIEKKIYRIDTKTKDESDCHLKSLDQCLNKAKYFTHSLNLTNVSEEKDFDNMCRAVIKVIKCMDRYFERCSYPVHKDLYQLGKDQFYQSYKHMCSEGPIRDSESIKNHKNEWIVLCLSLDFIKHSLCIQKSVKESEEYKSVCINDLQKAFNKSMISTNMIDIMNIGCCAFNQWQQCIDRYLWSTK